MTAAETTFSPTQFDAPASTHPIGYLLPLQNNLQVTKMPQHRLATGTVSYPDAKSNYPAFPQVGFGKAIAIGLGAGAIGALV